MYINEFVNEAVGEIDHELGRVHVHQEPVIITELDEADDSSDKYQRDIKPVRARRKKSGKKRVRRSKEDNKAIGQDFLREEVRRLDSREQTNEEEEIIEIILSPKAVTIACDPVAKPLYICEYHSQLSPIEEAPSIENESTQELRAKKTHQLPNTPVVPRTPSARTKHQPLTTARPRTGRSKPSAEEEELEAMINLTKITTYQDKICLVLHDIG